MEDGSMIYSNGTATIEYPEHFANNSREINQLQGVAFFEITKNPNRPFIIHNRVANIKVVGTSFQTRMDSDRAEVIVRTGKVIVFNKEEQVALLPGEKVIFYSSGKKAVMQTNEDMNYLFWKTNLLEYDNISLQKVCEDIEQKFDCRIELPNTLQTKIVHGRYFAEDLPQLLNTLSETFNSTYTTQGRNVKFLLK
jgi:ferric-dicitrate binding protein FerR (iron transport regulator)